MARKLGLTPRREAKIKPFEDLLIVQSDSEVGRRADVDTEIVRMYRFAHGFLKPGESMPAPEPAPEKPARAAKAPKPAKEAEAPKRHGGPVSALESYTHLLGTMSDRDVARRADVTLAAVAQYRRRRGIGAYIPPKAASEAEATPASSARPGPVSSLDAHLDRMGKRPDAEIATLAGVSRSAVTQYRKRRGIQAFAPKVAREAAPVATKAPRAEKPAPVAEPEAAVEAAVAPPPPAAAAPAVTDKGHFAISFIVKVRRGETENDYLVVGPDLAAAAAHAVRSVGGSGDVVSITRHMDALI